MTKISSGLFLCKNGHPLVFQANHCRKKYCEFNPLQYTTPRVCAGKVKYPSNIQAQLAGIKIEQRAYKCNEGRHWHLTSQLRNIL